MNGNVTVHTAHQNSDLDIFLSERFSENGKDIQKLEQPEYSAGIRHCLAFSSGPRKGSHCKVRLMLKV